MEVHIWCDGPRGNDGLCDNGDQNEYGTSIAAVRAFLRELGWKTRKRDGVIVDICPMCQELEKVK